MDITALAAIKALDGLQLRQTVTANNIANANAEGFLPARVSFEAALGQALALGDADAVANIPVTQTLMAPGSSLAKVRIDQEVADMSQTTLRYQLLINMLDSRLATAKLAIDSGRSS
jgi:flagellar basal-body rod protein FlgB